MNELLREQSVERRRQQPPGAEAYSYNHSKTLDTHQLRETPGCVLRKIFVSGVYDVWEGEMRDQMDQAARPLAKRRWTTPVFHPIDRNLGSKTHCEANAPPAELPPR
jgi:hypothetical protein